MKTSALENRHEAGSALVTTIVLCLVIGVVLLSFLELIDGRTKVRARSYSWNQAIPVLDSGIEEALTHLQDDGTNLTSNGWLKSGSGVSTLYLKGGTNSDKSFFITTISNASLFPIQPPVIYSQGFVLAPYSDGYISRLVLATLARGTNFGKAIVAKGKIDLNGQSVVDSFDSSNTNYSTGGRYDPAKRKSGGSVVSDYRGTPSVDVGNGHIYGTATTGPGGTVAYNGGGTVGDVAWSAGNIGIEPGYSANDANVEITDPQAPAGWSSWTPLTKVSGILSKLGGTNYTYVVTGNVTANGGLSMDSHDAMVVVGNATLYIGGNFTINGNAYIYIAPGASLTVYVAGGTTTLNGGGIINGTGTASNFSYIGLSGNTSIKYAGGADFVGTINAPEADFTITGGASLYGAAIVNTYTSKSSGAGLHFDESVMKPGILTVTSYREL